MESANTLPVGTIIIELFGGLALFLFGMELMTDALKNVAGSGMKNLLARLTTNRFKAAFAGAFVTAVIQSSSVTTVLTVGFITAGLLSVTQSVGIIMGANVGTTITAQIIAFKITQYALILVAAGFGLFFMAKQEKTRQYGGIIMGLGLIFFGMELMSEATQPLRTYQPFIDLMQSMDNPLWAILISAAFTAIVQSSSATTGIIIVLASQGFITLEAGIALVFGANLGTCVTAILSALGKPREAVQAAAVHVLFNIIGIVVWLGFIDQLANVVRLVSPAAAELEGLARLAAETPRQIANAHSVFNVGNTLIFIWFAGPLAVLVQRLVPEQPESQPDVIQPKYLDDVLLETPELALDRVRLELGRLGTCALEMVQASLPIIMEGSKIDLEDLEEMDEDVDVLHGAIITYLGHLSQENLWEEQSALISDYIAAANYLENIGDMIETNFVETGMARLNANVEISQQTQTVLKALHDKVAWAVQESLLALESSDKNLAQSVIKAKPEISRLAQEAENHLAQRLTATVPNRLATFRVESEMIEYLRRIYYFAKRIAKVVTELEAFPMAERE